MAGPLAAIPAARSADPTALWRRDDGAMVRVDRCLIDANWGQSSNVVYQFCRQSKFASVVMPSHGRYVGTSSSARDLVRFGNRDGRTTAVRRG